MAIYTLSAALLRLTRECVWIIVKMPPDAILWHLSTGFSIAFNLGLGFSRLLNFGLTRAARPACFREVES